MNFTRNFFHNWKSIIVSQRFITQTPFIYFFRIIRFFIKHCLLARITPIANVRHAHFINIYEKYVECYAKVLAVNKHEIRCRTLDCMIFNSPFQIVSRCKRNTCNIKGNITDKRSNNWSPIDSDTICKVYVMYGCLTSFAVTTCTQQANAISVADVSHVAFSQV